MIGQQALTMLQIISNRGLEAFQVGAIFCRELLRVPKFYLMNTLHIWITMLFELWFQQQVIGVSHDNRAADCFETRNDLTRLWTRSSYVAQTDDLLDIAGCDSIEYSIESNEVSVDIGDDGNRHENTPESL